MKHWKLILSGILTLTLFYGLNQKFGQFPPFGKFLDPYKGFWQNEQTESYGEEELALEGLTEPVRVYYDEHLIPHIFANNEADLYRAQGYITAKHRLWQMEFQTHAAAGRVSELIGAAGIGFDREQRRKGMIFGAENSLEKMKETPEIVKLQEAYRDGYAATERWLELNSGPGAVASLTKGVQ